MGAGWVRPWHVDHSAHRAARSPPYRRRWLPRPRPQGDVTGTRFERRFLPEPAEVPPLRAALREWLHDLDLRGEEESDDILIVASELVTNGVYHDGGDLITLSVERHENEVAIVVVTVEHPAGQTRHGGITDPIEGGRGLGIVRELSKNFNVLTTGTRRISSCLVPIASSGAAELVTEDPVAALKG
ncbi:MAG: ATP-binding protein [Acidimicrobiales bacterium]